MSKQAVVTVDRMTCTSRPVLIETVSRYIAKGALVQIEDRSRPRSMRLCYDIRPGRAALQLFGAHGRPIGVFADVAALLDHAEAVTR